MQRVRIGLTGLALVFVLVLLGAVIRSASEDESLMTNGIEHQLSPGGSNEQSSQATEPLAELGVAPGNADVNNSSADAGAKD
jgi:hypothetical protein